MITGQLRKMTNRNSRNKNMINEIKISMTKLKKKREELE